MRTIKTIMIFILILFIIFLYRCIPPEQITLPGDLTGYVTEAETSQPIGEASVELNQNNVTTHKTNTGNDGSYLFKNIAHGEYEVHTSKFGYAQEKKNITVEPAETKNVDFNLNKIPVPIISDTLLDFGIDSTSLKFTISRINPGIITYALNPSQQWINVSPSSGEVSGETDTITVTIDKTGLSKSVYKEIITVASFNPLGEIPDIVIDVWMNGIVDLRSGSYINVVRIGAQIWMAENLNIGERIQGNIFQSDNEKIEKYCYNNEENYCFIYGGLYQWDEAMQYNPSDTGIVGSTQGICPPGWHLPTWLEVDALVETLGGPEAAGGKMKETGYTHWLSPNTGATNESGFSGLPGGGNVIDQTGNDWAFEGISGTWFTSTAWGKGTALVIGFDLHYDSKEINVGSGHMKEMGTSVRCVKDP